MLTLIPTALSSGALRFLHERMGDGL